jgi:hypothetical protein
MTLVVESKTEQTETVGIYQGNPLFSSELQVMQELEKILGCPIPVVAVNHWRTFGFEVHNNHVIKLSIHKMGLSDLPESIEKLNHLQELYLGHNKLTQLPEGIGNLHDLRTLVLDHNEITGVPDTLGNLQKLHTLDLSNNKLKTLPIGFYTMKSLRMVDIGGNLPLKIPTMVERWLVRLRQIGGTIFR